MECDEETIGKAWCALQGYTALALIAKLPLHAFIVITHFLKERKREENDFLSAISCDEPIFIRSKMFFQTLLE